MAAKFMIPAGTGVQICRAGERLKSWRDYKTTRDLHFCTFVRFDGKRYLFREETWLIDVHRQNVRRAT